MAFILDGRVNEIPPERLGGLTEEQARGILSKVHAGARRGFQFYYHYFPIVEPYFQTPDQGPLAALFEWLNSAAMLDFVRRVTGLADIRWADAHAAMYAPGQFLSSHDDLKPHLQRRAAYVLNFTRDWRNDWGGYLQFFDEDGNVTAALKPGFNMLNMFTVPQEHSVGMVSPYAQGRRYSVTGWFRADPPPGAIG
jgi:Rps23 Pro-64 3,4-dihydroxylase Tpa1-like proline 4-hydroxylase